ncbi:MAG: pyridoxal phosphate-dependent aminotransferase [Culicoidibacterales bacterium]
MKKIIEAISLYTPPSSDDINLSMNENHHINWNDMLEQPLLDIHKEHHYSEYGAVEHQQLVEKYAQYVGLEPDNILVFSGSESAISVLITAFVEQKLMLFDPDFFRFEEVANLLEKQVIKMPLYPQFDIANVIETINAQSVELCLFSNPNNPLGTMISAQHIIDLLEQTNAYIVVDEAYIEFSAGSVVDLIPKYPKLLIMRTMSKGWGLSSIRVGFVLGQADVITYLLRALGPFNLSQFITKIAAQAMEHESQVSENIEKIKGLRQIWEEKLEHQFGFDVIPSQTNFIYVMKADASEIYTFLVSERIHVAYFKNPESLRISIGNSREMDELELALHKYRHR